MLAGLGLQDEFPINVDMSSWPKMRARFAEVFRTKSQDEWVEVYKSKDACFAPVLTLDEATKHPHNVARGSFFQGRLDKKEFMDPSPAPKLSRTPAGSDPRDQPKYGEHTVDVLLQEGLQKSEIDQLLKENVIRQYVPSASL